MHSCIHPSIHFSLHLLLYICLLVFPLCLAHDETCFEPVKIGNLELKNRLVRSATREGIAQPDGSMTEQAHKCVFRGRDKA